MFGFGEEFMQIKFGRLENEKLWILDISRVSGKV